MLVSEGLTLTPGYPPAGGGADFAPWTQGTPSAEPAGASLLGVSIQCPEVYVARFLQQVCVCVCVMGVGMCSVVSLEENVLEALSLRPPVGCGA